MKALQSFVLVSVVIFAFGQAVAWLIARGEESSRNGYLARAEKTQATLVDMKPVTRTSERCNTRRGRGSRSQRESCHSETNTHYSHVLDVRTGNRVVRASLSAGSPLPYRTGETFEVLYDRTNPTDVRETSYVDARPDPHAYHLIAGVVSFMFMMMVGLLFLLMNTLLSSGLHQDLVEAVKQREQGGQPRQPWDHRKAG